MSSLPQGWHGIPVPIKNSTSSSTSASTTVPTTIRKRWNSPLATDAPRSKLPSYKTSNLRTTTKNKQMAQSTSISSCSGSKSEPLSKPLLAKEYKNEIAKLKKELSVMKAENSILKVRVRRVDDENTQKSRQIEKMRGEFKDKQKNESSDDKKNKELLLLRQKCLRLESALKEMAVRKGINAKSLKNISNSKTPIQKESVDSEQLQSLNETVTLEKTSSAQSTVSSRSQTVRSEITKLQDIIHKLEKENQDLQLQVKNKGEEIRSLKMQMRTQKTSKSHQTATIKLPLKLKIPLNTISNTLVPNQLKENNTKENSAPPKVAKTIVPKVQATKTAAQKIKSTGTNALKVNNAKSLPNVNNSVNKSAKSISSQNKKASPQGALKTDSKKPEAPVKNEAPKTKKNPDLNGSLKKVPKVQVKNGTTSNAKAPKSGSTFVVDAKPISIRSGQKATITHDKELEIKKLKENIAAKKIQRSWRNHHNKINPQVNPDHQRMKKATTFIVASVKHHKMRKDKLNFLGKYKSSPRLENEDAIVEAIQAATKNLWVVDELNSIH